MPSLIEHIAAALFGGAAGDADERDRQLVEDMIEVVVETVDPRIRALPRYREKLAGGVRRTIAHLRALGRERLEPVPLSRAAWSQDPRVNAFFARADEVSACVGRSDEIRRFFERRPGCREAWALLGMKREERKVLAPRLEGDVLRQDVPQITVSFSGHRLIAPAEDEAQTRLEVGRRIIERLAQLALARIARSREKATDLEQRKAYLDARLRTLKLARNGVERLVSDPAKTEEQIREVERELEKATASYAEAKSGLLAPDRTIDEIDAVLAKPEEQVALARVPLRINRMGIKVEAGSIEPAAELDLTELALGDGLRATVALVRIPRSELPPKEDLVAQAERTL